MNIKPQVLTHLPYLAEVARTLSFTKAAEAMHLTQAALSYQIKQLEEKVGCQLVLRQSGSQLKLTSAGESLVKEYVYCAKRLVLALSQLDHKANYGELRITTPVDLGSILMPKIMAYFKIHAPDLKIDLHTSDAIMDLQSSRWEMAIRVNSQKDVIDKTPIATTLCYVVASPDYLKNNGIPKTLNQLKSHTILVRESSKYRAWSRLFNTEKLQFSQFTKRIVLGNSFAIREAAKEGLGIAILPKFIVKDELEQRSLVSFLQESTSSISAEFFIARIDAPQLESYELIMRNAFNNIFGGEFLR
jgi:DNA-binding transcriptional LysR family regulator